MVFGSIVIFTSLLLVFSLGLGVLSLVRNPQSELHRLWFYLCMLICLWSMGSVVSMITSDPNIALVWAKIMFAVAALLPLFFLHFVLLYGLWPQKTHTPIKIGYVVGGLFFFFSLFTSFIVKSPETISSLNIQSILTQPLLGLYLLYIILANCLGVAVVWISYQRNGGFRRQYFFFLMIGWIIFIITNITNVVMSKINWYPIGHLVMRLYPLLIIYGVFFDRPTIKMR